MRDKRETETHPGVGVVKEEKVPNSRKPSHRQVCGEFWNLRVQHYWGKKKKERKKMYLIATASREVAQTLTSTPAGGSWTGRLGMHHQCYRVRIQPKCHEDNLRDLT